jgi:hypothetical protein
MPTFEIEEFARILVQHVRDSAIQSSDMQLRTDVDGPIAMRWKDAARDGTAGSVLTVAIPDIVDDVLFYLLLAIDQEVLSLSFVASNGKIVSLPADGLGELGGWYMGSGGWRAMYSKERFVDDFADLTYDAGEEE